MSEGAGVEAGIGVSRSYESRNESRPLYWRKYGLRSVREEDEDTSQEVLGPA
jgi:hypothetical protein